MYKIKINKLTQTSAESLFANIEGGSESDVKHLHQVQYDSFRMIDITSNITTTNTVSADTLKTSNVTISRF